MFIDQARIHVYGGPGGAGAEAFRREPGVPRGGPSGGSGGRGGDVVLVVNPQATTLLDLSFRQHYRGERGRHGEGNDKTGRSGSVLEIPVPPGTIVRDAQTGETLGELLEEDDRLVVAKGGRGGRGNAKFKSSTQQAPRHWESGGEGEERQIALELKLIADVGLVGEPNAGKSTFLSVASAAQPKIADYPFTTLQPNLGVVSLSDHRTFVLADIPGIIEGAHEGKGLGIQFLRHIERTRTLVFMVPADSEDPTAEYVRLRAEVSGHSTDLAERPHCVALTKADVLGGEAPPHVEAPDAWGVMLVSSLSREGLPELIESLWAHSRPVGQEAEEQPWTP